MARIGKPEIRAVSRNKDKIDLFAVGQDGIVVSASWQRDETEWNGWFSIADGRCVPGASVTPVSRRADYLDVFCIGMDGGVYTASWNPDDGAQWQGWLRIGDAQVPLGSMVGAVSSMPDFLDIFVVATDGSVRTSCWDPTMTGWMDWQWIAGAVAPAGSPVTAISCEPGRIDLFLVGSDQRVYTNAYLPDVSSWQDWAAIGETLVPLRTEIAAVSRRAGAIDIFATDVDGAVVSAALDPGAKEWNGWWQIADGRSDPGTPVAAVSRAKDQLDIFVTTSDGAIWTAAWEPEDGTTWRGWWTVATVEATASGFISALSRSSEQLDVVAVLPDGTAVTAAWQTGDATWRGWWPISDWSIGYTAAMVPDPQMAGWNQVFDKTYGSDWQTHTVEGITFSGQHIFVSVTTHKNKCLVYRFLDLLDAKPEEGVSINNISENPGHIGDIDWYNGILYGSLEQTNGPYGLGVVEMDEDLFWLRDVPLSGATPGSQPPQTHCPWVAVNPWTGMLYTSDFDGVTRINAYSLFDYTLQEAYCVDLVGADISEIGGGVFDQNGHLFVSSGGYGDIRAFNALNGQFLGNTAIDVGSGEEVEGLGICPTALGANAEIHLMLWKDVGLSWPGLWGDAVRKIYTVPNAADIVPDF